MLRSAFCLFLLVGLFSSGGYSSSSDHFDGRHFFNPWIKSDKGFFDFLKWQFTRDQASWPEWVQDNKMPDLASPSVPAQIKVTFINHATFYIQLGEYSILTDPVFSDRVSPVSFAGPKRSRAVGATIAELPKLDFVLISHSHYDHLDKESVRQLTEKFDPVFLVPMKTKELVESFGAKKVIELDWWQTHQLSTTEAISFAPAQHWTARGIFDRNEMLWGSFIIEAAGRKIYFAGDTGYGPHFKWIQQKWQNFDLSILPIGAYEPRWFMKEQHMNPEDAVMAHIDLNSKLSLGAHFGTFQLTDEGIDAPIEDLMIALTKLNLSNEDFKALKNGETISIF